MSDPLYDIIYDIQHHGFSILTIAGIIIWLLKERRDSALFHNQKIIMERLEVGKQWSNGQLNGWKPTLRPLSKRQFFLSHRAIPQGSPSKRRKKNMQKLKSRKFWLAILAAVLPIVNSQFDLGMNPDAVIAAIAGLIAFILGESHVDAKKAQNDPNKFIQG